MERFFSIKPLLALVGALLLLQAAALWLFGQPWICECGFISLWANDPLSPENSQQLADWYTLSHILHGFIFYWLLGYFFPRLSFGAKMLIATGVEVGWELLENTPWLIEHYRQQALAVGYTGDSILNSISDTIAMLVGFVAARRLPVWASVTVAVGLEALPLFFIRDSLILNAMNLIYSSEAVEAWQQGK